MVVESRTNDVIVSMYGMCMYGMCLAIISVYGNFTCEHARRREGAFPVRVWGDVGCREEGRARREGYVMYFMCSCVRIGMSMRGTITTMYTGAVEMKRTCTRSEGVR